MEHGNSEGRICKTLQRGKFSKSLCSDTYELGNWPPDVILEHQPLVQIIVQYKCCRGIRALFRPTDNKSVAAVIAHRVLPTIYDPVGE